MQCLPRVVARQEFGTHHFSCCSILHWLDQDGVTVTFGEYHDVLISFAGLLGESPCLVCPHFLGGFVHHIYNMDEDGLLFLDWAFILLVEIKVIVVVHRNCHLWLS